jgi:uncharacterized protein (UPF0248 family)
VTESNGLLESSGEKKKEKLLKSDYHDKIKNTARKYIVYKNTYPPKHRSGRLANKRQNKEIISSVFIHNMRKLCMR